MPNLAEDLTDAGNFPGSAIRTDEKGRTDCFNSCNSLLACNIVLFMLIRFISVTYERGNIPKCYIKHLQYVKPW